MRRRFFVDQVRNGHAAIEGEDARHLTRVLRVEPGQRYEISDNRNVYLAEIVTAHKESVIFQTLEQLGAPELPVRIVLCAALIKFDHFEWIVEKATELGVAEIIPVEAARSDKGLDRAAVKRVDRWRKIALEASQQSRRARLPEVSEPVSFAEALARQADHRFALDEEPGGVALAHAIPSGVASVALLTGAEGGWTDAERAAFAPAGWTRATLGPLILRAETAAIAALAVVAATLTS